MLEQIRANGEEKSVEEAHKCEINSIDNAWADWEMKENPEVINKRGNNAIDCL